MENEDPNISMTFILSSRTKERATDAVRTVSKQLVGLKNIGKVKFDILTVDLTSMESTKRAIEELQERYEYINYFFVNAALGLCDGINWFRAVYEVLTNPIKAMTDPDYRIQKTGLVSNDGMGYIFQANVFGTYYMIQSLISVLSKGKCVIVWISSLCSTRKYLSLDDIELIESKRPYDGSKRVVDLLHLATYKNLRAKDIYQYVAQPGIFISQSFATKLNFFTFYAMLLFFKIVRRWGSFWHTIDGYRAANAPCHVVTFKRKDFERQDIKYGSATYSDGVEYIKTEEIDPFGKDEVYSYIEGKKMEWDDKLNDNSN